MLLCKLQDDELDISPVEIDEGLVIEDDDISDDDDDDDNDDVCCLIISYTVNCEIFRWAYIYILLVIDLPS